MSDVDWPTSPTGPGGRPPAVPLFYRKRTCKSGESEEISLGPSVVGIYRWTVILIIVAVLILAGAQPSILLKFLLRLLP